MISCKLPDFFLHFLLSSRYNPDSSINQSSPNATDLAETLTSGTGHQKCLRLKSLSSLSLFSCSRQLSKKGWFWFLGFYSTTLTKHHNLIGCWSQVFFFDSLVIFWKKCQCKNKIDIQEKHSCEPYLRSKLLRGWNPGHDMRRSRTARSAKGCENETPPAKG